MLIVWKKSFLLTWVVEGFLISLLMFYYYLVVGVFLLAFFVPFCFSISQQTVLDFAACAKHSFHSQHALAFISLVTK